MKMNLPNKLTVLRMLLVPVFVVFMLLSTGNRAIGELRAAPDLRFLVFRYAAFVIFAGASLTDYFDGRIARREGLVTNFGKFMDPLADKLLVCSALILLGAEGSMPVWAVLIIIWREFIISGFRLVASDAGIVIAANMWGKLKTVSQMFLCILLILPRLPVLVGSRVTACILWAVVLLTLVSLVDYIRKNIHVLTEGGF